MGVLSISLFVANSFCCLLLTLSLSIHTTPASHTLPDFQAGNLSRLSFPSESKSVCWRVASFHGRIRDYSGRPGIRVRTTAIVFLVFVEKGRVPHHNSNLLQTMSTALTIFILLERTKNVHFADESRLKTNCKSCNPIL
jgi:hypothetical protein